MVLARWKEGYIYIDNPEISRSIVLIKICPIEVISSSEISPHRPNQRGWGGCTLRAFNRAEQPVHYNYSDHLQRDRNNSLQSGKIPAVLSAVNNTIHPAITLHRPMNPYTRTVTGWSFLILNTDLIIRSAEHNIHVKQRIICFNISQMRKHSISIFLSVLSHLPLSFSLSSSLSR